MILCPSGDAPGGTDWDVKYPLTSKNSLPIVPAIGSKASSKNVIFGIFPTDIHGSEAVRDDVDMSPIDAHVEVVEPLGSEILI